MTGHEFLSIYPAKLLEYTLAAGYLLLFIPFWRYVQGGRSSARLPAEVRERPAGATAPAVGAWSGWFGVPDRVYLHPGHTWARTERDGRVTVGLDDFAHKLIGPVTQVGLPEPGAVVAQGEPAIEVGGDHKAVSLLSPVDGAVVAVNRAAAEEPERLADPYGRGWLFQVRPARLEANVKQLLSGTSARRWLEEASESLAARLSPELGHVLQDGGVPVHGIARELDSEKWDDIARKYFLT